MIWKLCLDLYELIQQQPDEERADYHPVQVRENFGSLRFYTHRWTPSMDELIARAWDESLHTCGVCGRPGSLLRGPGLWRTRCARHPEQECAYSYFPNNPVER
jgi:hypothetical protein